MSQVQAEQVTGALVGQVIEGRYQVTSLLEGTLEVEYYQGQQAALDRPVVLKVLHPQAAGRRDLAERFLREGRALAQLDHPRIAHVLDVGVFGGLPYVVRDQVPGARLETLLEGGRRFTVAEAQRILVELLGAVQHLHQHGLVHRDLSPSKLVLSEDGLPRIVDFQSVQIPSAKEAPKLTGMGMVLGDPRYAAAEQLMGFPTDPRSDLYSLGVLGYRLIAGILPFQATTPAALIALQGRPARPLGEVVSLPPEAAPLAALIDSMLAIAPKERPQSAEQALARLGPEAPAVALASPAGAPLGPDLVTEAAIALPPSVWQEQLETVVERLSDWRERATVHLTALQAEWGPKWQALGRTSRLTILGSAAATLLAAAVVIAAPRSEDPVVAIEVVSTQETPVEDTVATAMLKEARGHADKRRVEKALDAYRRAALRAPDRLEDRDLHTISGYLARKDWLTSAAEKILVRVGPRAVPELQAIADNPKANAFHRRRAEETLRALPEADRP